MIRDRMQGRFIQDFFFRHGTGLTVNGTGILVALAGQILFARLLGVEAFGVLGLTLALVLLIVSLSDGGLGVSVPRFVSMFLGEKRPSALKPLIRISGAFLGGVSLVVGGILYGLAPYLAGWFSIPAFGASVQTLALFVPAIFLARWAMGVLKGLGLNTIQITLETLLTPVLVLGLGYGLYQEQPGIAAILTGYGLTYMTIFVIGLIVALVHLRKFPGGPGAVSLRELISHGMPGNIAKMGQRLLKRGDMIVIGAMLGGTAAGLYRTAFMMVNGIRKGLVPIQSFANYYISKSLGENKPQAIQGYYTVAVLLGLAFALPMYLLLMVYAVPLLDVLFGNEFVAAAPVLRVLCVGFAFYAFMGPMTVLYNALGQNMYLMKTVLVVAAANIMLNIGLIYLLGLNGAAWATSLSVALHYTLLSRYIRGYFFQRAELGWGYGFVMGTLVLSAALILFNVQGMVLIAITALSALGILGSGLYVAYKELISFTPEVTG